MLGKVCCTKCSWPGSHIVRDACSRLPNGEGTRLDVRASCWKLKVFCCGFDIQRLTYVVYMYMLCAKQGLCCVKHPSRLPVAPKRKKRSSMFPEQYEVRVKGNGRGAGVV